MIIPLTDEDQPPEMPLATFGLIGANVLVYPIFGYMESYQDIVNNWGYVPAHPSAMTPMTALFLHGGLLHLIGNMLYLWVVGPNMESALGRAGFLAFFVACGTFGNFAHGQMVAHGGGFSQPCVGASGAIAGVLGAYILLYPRNRIRFFYWIWLARGTFAVAAVFPILFWFVQQFMLGTDTGHATTSVAYGAHLGGFCVGAIAAGLLVLLGLVQPRWQARESSKPQYW